ncbi:MULTISPECIES: N-6 DNA methylase [unclassified Frigoribacterium]|uniref:class I SAM-dependent DNA methyltransferase n=1 Tax=unclassified Frigoribacterium TaxID=2627005 RepID=UPI0006F573BC|nr:MULTISPECIES: N-6 DNA methylase [unclassified Frigoribacterium]KQN39167.1 SAM-dependent methyltransferase [Frigoribacterium sp. Leaf44]
MSPIAHPEIALTQSRLQAVIKEARNIMRKDAGLNGELDRLPQLAWLLFLKAFDDLEDERKILDPGYRPALPTEYRWLTWAGESNLTGDPLLNFVNEKLLPHIRGLQGTGDAGDPRDTLARVFTDVSNRMRSGHLLRALIDQLDSIQFSKSDEMHAMAVFYESMLREMRDAAGDSGEFYTPRPLIKFVVDQVDPKPGEAIMDPAVGTAGFLLEAYRHATKNASAGQVQQTAAQLRGVEKKPMPFLLAEMNLLLHGVDRPNLQLGNSLAFGLNEVARDGVDVVVTNPPFGGEEEALIATNFPTQYRTQETVWLFLQSIMARISTSRSGRAGVVVPNSTLFDTGVGARIKRDLMERFNLHTVVRLPNGVFSPYTLIPSNVLFFERGKQDTVWFYEIAAPDGRKNYTKTKPMRVEEFADCQEWWGGNDRAGRIETEHAWKVPLEEIVESEYNLDRHSPNRAASLDQRSPRELVAELLDAERELLEVYEQLLRQIEGFTA